MYVSIIIIIVFIAFSRNITDTILLSACVYLPYCQEYSEMSKQTGQTIHWLKQFYIRKQIRNQKQTTSQKKQNASNALNQPN